MKTKLIALVASVLMALSLCACEKDSKGVLDHNCDGIAGIYTVVSGTQKIIDNMGGNQEDELTGYAVAVAQSGCIAEFFDCMVYMENGEGKCDTELYGSNQFYGLYYYSVQGNMTFDGKDMQAHIMVHATYPQIGYSGTNEVTLKATLDEETTNKARTGDGGSSGG